MGALLYGPPCTCIIGRAWTSFGSAECTQRSIPKFVAATYRSKQCWKDGSVSAGDVLVIVVVPEAECRGTTRGQLAFPRSRLKVPVVKDASLTVKLKQLQYHHYLHHPVHL